jgi:hypothetical protein
MAVEEVAEMASGEGAVIAPIWVSDVPAHYPNDGAAPPAAGRIFPPVGGARVAIVRLKAGGTQSYDREIVEGFGPLADPARPGMHRTATTDFDLVLEGELVLELDEGEIELSPGDVVVQNGTFHRWVNRGNKDAVWAAFVIGAEHDVAPEF